MNITYFVIFVEALCLYALRVVYKLVFRVMRGLGNQEFESTSFVTLPIEFDGITLEVDLFIVAPSS